MCLLKKQNSSQWTTVVTDKESDEFPIAKGSKQRDPLSSLLFNSVLQFAMEDDLRTYFSRLPLTHSCAPRTLTHSILHSDVDAQCALCSLSVTSLFLQCLTIQIHSDDPNANKKPVSNLHKRARYLERAWLTDRLILSHRFCQVRRPLRLHESDPLADRNSQRPSEVPVLKDSHRDPTTPDGLPHSDASSSSKITAASSVPMFRSDKRQKTVCLTKNLSRKRLLAHDLKGREIETQM